MYTDTTSNGLTHIKAHEGYVMTEGNEIVKEIWLTGGGVNEWTEVSALVLLSPEEQQRRINEMQAQIEQNQSAIDEWENKWNDKSALVARVNELGKVEQTETGDGSEQNPFRNFKIGDEVEAGKWYYVPDPNDEKNPYLWQAIKTGIPSHELDAEYFEIMN